MHIASLVTLVIVPRERFSMGPASLRQVLSRTPVDVPVVFVEGRPPERVRNDLHAAADRPVDFIATPHYLSPNNARNLGFQRVATPYVVFLDNDVWVEPDWLEALLSCAEEEQAAVVGPLYRQGQPEDREVHMAGGLAHIIERDGRRLVRSSHDYQGKPLDEVLPELRRSETELAEFHGMLVRSAVLRDLGGLDEGLLNTREHIDFCMSIRAAGGKVFLEPASQLTYSRPPPFALGDLRYFSLRWSEDWSAQTLDHFFTKWELDRSQIPHLMTWTKKQRYRFLEPWYSRTTRWLAHRVGQERMVKVLQYTLYPLEGFLNRCVNGLLGAGQRKP
ncbi:MAG: glycosyltransferase family 2 protein [Congregibacter sp.]